MWRNKKSENKEIRVFLCHKFCNAMELKMHIQQIYFNPDLNFVCDRNSFSTAEMEDGIISHEQNESYNIIIH
jgi:hypothetical protein